MVVGDPVQVGADRYYRVMDSEFEPRLQDYYIKSVDLIAAPDDTANKAMAAKLPLSLMKLKYADAQGLPVFEARTASRANQCWYALAHLGGTKGDSQRPRRRDYA